MKKNDPLKIINKISLGTNLNPLGQPIEYLYWFYNNAAQFFDKEDKLIFMGMNYIFFNGAIETTLSRNRRMPFYINSEVLSKNQATKLAFKFFVYLKALQYSKLYLDKEITEGVQQLKNRIIIEIISVRTGNTSKIKLLEYIENEKKLVIRIPKKINFSFEKLNDIVVEKIINNDVIKSKSGNILLDSWSLDNLTKHRFNKNYELKISKIVKTFLNDPEITKIISLSLVLLRNINKKYSLNIEVKFFKDFLLSMVLYSLFGAEKYMYMIPQKYFGTFLDIDVFIVVTQNRLQKEKLNLSNIVFNITLNTIRGESQIIKLKKSHLSKTINLDRKQIYVLHLLKRNSFNITKVETEMKKEGNPLSRKSIIKYTKEICLIILKENKWNLDKAITQLSGKKALEKYVSIKYKDYIFSTNGLLKIQPVNIQNHIRKKYIKYYEELIIKKNSKNSFSNWEEILDNYICL